jgi:hypothetical protein
MKFIGYFLIGVANVVLEMSGLGIDTWQYWVIMPSFIIGEFLVCIGGKDD